MEEELFFHPVTGKLDSTEPCTYNRHSNRDVVPKWLKMAENQRKRNIDTEVLVEMQREGSGGFYASNLLTSQQMGKFISNPDLTHLGSPSFSVETIHISCKSDAYQGTGNSYAGVIIYSCDGKSQWQTANGTRCKSGYLVIMDTGTEKVKSFQSQSPGQVHGAVYKSAFGEECTARNVNAEGFSVMKGELKINSGVFNPAKDGYHDEKRSMHPISARCIEKVIESWKNAGKSYRLCKNFAVKDLLSEEQQVRLPFIDRLTGWHTQDLECKPDGCHRLSATMDIDDTWLCKNLAHQLQIE